MVYAAYNVWKVVNCWEPDGLGYATFACPVHPSEICHVPRSCKSRFCSVCAKVQIDKWVTDMNQLFPNCSYFHITFTVPTQSRTLLFEKRSLLNAVFSASTETVISFCKERGFLPAVTAVLHTFGSDLKRHVHIHCIVSAGGLKLTGKAERFTRFAKRKKKNSKAKKKKVSVVEDNSRWFECHFFPYKMLQKRYQTLLLEHLKKTIENNIKSSDPDHDLLIFSNPLVVKSYEHRMFLWSFDEYFLPWELIAFFLAALTASHGYIRNNIHSWIFALFYTIGLLQNTSSRHL